MLNKIIKLSLSNRFLIVVGAVIILISGIIVIPRQQVDVFPDLTAPTVVIMTESESMSAEDVERMVTFPIETAINGAMGVRRIRSISQTGFSVVTVEFDWGENLYTVRQIVSEKLAGISSSLPNGVGEPILAPQTSLMGEVMVIGLTSKDGRTSLQQLRTIADWTFRTRLMSVAGVANVAVTGGDIKEYNILLSPSLMKHYGVSVNEVLEACRNLNSDGNGGVIDYWGNEYVIRTLNRSADPEIIARNTIKISEKGHPITISDIADVKIGNRKPRIGDASINGKEAVRLSVTKQPGVSTVDLTERLDKIIEEIKTTLPEDIEIKNDIFRQEDFIKSSINNISRALWEGGILVIVILFLFLGNPRTTIISLLAIPISLIFAILSLKLLGMSLNTMSIGGLAIAVGSLVDDAIIDVENVYKRLRENTLIEDSSNRKKVLDIIFEASSEIRGSIWNATLIIIVTFTPLFFLSGMEGRMLIPLGISFIISLFASMIVAITLTPVLCSLLLTEKKQHRGTENESWISIKIKEYYRIILDKAISNSSIVIMISVILLLGSLATIPFLGNSFLPQFNEGSMTIEISAMPGISLDESSRIGNMAEKMIMEVPEVKVVSRKTGRSELDEHALGTNTSEMDVPFTIQSRSRKNVFTEMREKLSQIPGVAIEIGQPISHRIDMLLSGSQASIAIKVFGNSLPELFSIGNSIKDAIEDIPGLVDLKVEQLVERPEIHIIPNKIIAASYGIKEHELNDIIETTLLGRNVGQVFEDGKSFNIVARLDENSRSNLSDIKSIPISTIKGNIELSDIAEIKSCSGANSISRENVSRRIIVSANLNGEDIVGTMDKIKREINSKVNIPKDYHIEYGGQGESAKKASDTLLIASVVALFIVFILLYREFESFKLAGITMLNLPLSLIGAIYTVLLTGAVVSIPTIIGFISLFGIAARNGLLLISHYENLKNLPLSVRQLIIQGSCDRIIPIVMTALTSALALVPLAVNGDLPGNEIQSPMAVVILGGLITSTLLNLIVIPIIYYKLCNRK